MNELVTRRHEAQRAELEHKQRQELALMDRFGSEFDAIERSLVSIETKSNYPIDREPVQRFVDKVRGGIRDFVGQLAGMHQDPPF